MSYFSADGAMDVESIRCSRNFVQDRQATVNSAGAYQRSSVKHPRGAGLLDVGERTEHGFEEHNDIDESP